MNIDNNWTEHCEAERLAHSGEIQPHGGLIYLNADLRISHVSAQIGNFLPHAPAALLGQPLPEPIEQILAPAIAKLPAKAGSRAESFAVLNEGKQNLDIVLSRGIDGIVIELIFQEEARTFSAHHLEHMTPPQNSNEVMALHQQMAQSFHELTGFNRVMIYAFREDGDGEVLAEARHAEVYGSYLGLRFPGSDIPQIARTLYLKNPWRLIPDSQATSVPLLSRENTAPDLTWSDLRSVSPVHRIYLANMGVRASLSFPIIANGELWGLIACHHSTPRRLSLPELHSASHLARSYSMALLAWQAQSRMRFADNLDRLYESVRLILLRHGNALNAADEIAPGLMEQFDACGMAIRLGDHWQQFGEIPHPQEFEQLDDWFADHCQDIVFSSDSLVRTHTNIGHFPVAGAMALKLRSYSKESLHLWLFRRELLYSVEWGGNPHKPVEFHDGLLDIAPRRSFEKFVENRIGYCAPWKNEERLKAFRLRQLLLEIYA
ncbi:MAG: GAF domain-containing protein [Methylobacter sp.]